MRSTCCVICKERKKVVGFDRDDPVLECGHILTIEAQIARNALDELEHFCVSLIQEKMDTLGVDFTTADKMVSTEIFGY